LALGMPYAIKISHDNSCIAIFSANQLQQNWDMPSQKQTKILWRQITFPHSFHLSLYSLCVHKKVLPLMKPYFLKEAFEQFVHSTASVMKIFIAGYVNHY
jgi:hypothetical protein